MRTTKILLVVLLMTAGVFSANAQTKSKIGVINIGELLKVMPEYDSVMVAYQTKYDQMQKDLQQLYSEFETKQAALAKDQNNLTEMMKSIRMQELDDLKNRIQSFQDGAQDELNKFVEAKQAPILKKIRTAINEVAVENGFTHILNNSQDQVLYYADAFDILPLVMKKLNLKEKPVPVGQ
jgi:outer membrane protein